MKKPTPAPYTPKRAVYIVCKDEAHQRDTYERLRQLGFDDLRVVTA